MSYASNTARYVENEVLVRSSEWLVPLLYEHLIINLRRAEIQIESGDLDGRSVSLGKANQIVSELFGSLDLERGGDIAKSLASFYSYFAVELLNIAVANDVGPLPRLIKVIEELHGAWVNAAEQVAPRGGRQTASASAA